MFFQTWPFNPAVLYAILVCAYRSLKCSDYAPYRYLAARKPALCLVFLARGSIPCLVLRLFTGEAGQLVARRTVGILPAPTNPVTPETRRLIPRCTL